MEPPTILVADDSKLALTVTAEILAAQGYRVITASDGVEALRRAYAEVPDLIILDVIMPILNGYHACRLLKQDPATRDIPVLIRTLRDQPADRFWGLQTGADSYLTKGQDDHLFLDEVKRLLQHTRRRRTPRPTISQPLDTESLLSRVNELLDRRLYESTILNEISRLSQGLHDFDKIAAAAGQLLAKLLRYEAAVLLMSGESGPMALLLSQASRPAAELERIIADSCVEWRALGGGPTTGEPLRTRIIVAEEARPATTPVALRLASRIGPEGAPYGLFALWGEPTTPVDEDERALVEMVGATVYVVLDNARLYEEVHWLAITDGLTRVFNRRYFSEFFPRECEKARRLQYPIGLLMVDLDHFKRLNDRYGHLTGDRALVAVAQAIRSSLRETDWVARFGGEEFAIVLPGCSQPALAAVGEKVRWAIAHTPVNAANCETLYVRASVGGSGATGRAIAAERLLYQADAALYQAKSAGRDRCVILPVDTHESD